MSTWDIQKPKPAQIKTLHQHPALEVHCVRVTQKLWCKHTRPRCVAPERSFSFSFLISSYANPLFLRSLARQHHPHPLMLRFPSCLLRLNLLSFILTWMFIFTRLRIGTPIFASIKTSDHFHELCLSVHVMFKFMSVLVFMFMFVFRFVFVLVLMFISKVRFWFFPGFRAVGNCGRLERCPVHTDLRLQLLERSLQLLRRARQF